MLGGFFNKESYFKAGVQATNLLVIAWAAYDLCTNPEASIAEHGANMLVNMLSALTLQGNDYGMRQFGATFLNTARMGSLYTAATSCPSVSGPLLLASGANNIANLAGFFSTSNQKVSEQPTNAVESVAAKTL